MFFFRKRTAEKTAEPTVPIEEILVGDMKKTTDAIAKAFGFTDEDMARHRIADEERMEDDQRRRWFRNRMWHNGPHGHCCSKCLQAGYVMALVRIGRLDLLAEYPELIAVYEELQRDGMLRSLPPSRLR